MPSLRIAIVDDSALIRKMVKEMLQRESAGWQVCGEASNADDALQLCLELKPDVLLLDWSLPPESGLTVAQRLRATQPEIQIVIISEQDVRTLDHLTRTYGFPCVAKSRLSTDLIPTLNRILPPGVQN